MNVNVNKCERRSGQLTGQRCISKVWDCQCKYLSARRRKSQLNSQLSWHIRMGKVQVY